jgi:hypothetical protein
MGSWRFKFGFVAGYVVATIRHSKDADPVIQRMKALEQTFRTAREWWKDLDEDHPLRRLVSQGRLAA